MSRRKDLPPIVDKADTLPPISGARRRHSAVRKTVPSIAPPLVVVVDRDPVFRLLVVALLEDTHRTVEAVDPYEAAHLWRTYDPDVLVARPEAAVQLPRLLVAPAAEPPAGELPVLIVVTMGDPVSLHYDGVATAVHRVRFVEDLPAAMARALTARAER
jgi:CheY-like chemotaxis protein